MSSNLDECVGNTVRLVGRYDVVTLANTSFLQVFLWEWFGVLAPNHVEFLTMEMGVVVSSDGLRMTKATNVCRARALVWARVKQLLISPW